MNDIFISYAHEDKATAQAIARIMENQQWTVWWDRDIPIGKSFTDVIATELENAKAVIVLWSKSSAASNWVRDEAQSGADRGKLVPALIEEAQIPYGFRQFQAANLTDWHGDASHPEMARLLNEVAKLLDKVPVIPDKTFADRLKVAFKRRRAVVVSLAALALVVFAVFKINPGIFSSADTTPTPVVSPVPPDGGGDLRTRAIEQTVRGLAAAGQSNYAGAILLYDEAVRIFAGYSDVYFYRGEAHAILKRNDEAIGDFRKFLEISSNEPNRRERQKAEEYLLGLVSPPLPAPSTQPGQTGPKTTATAATTPGFHAPPIPSSQVSAIFDDDKSTRIGATTQLVIKGKNDPNAVAMAVDTAKANPDKKSGVINALVYLQSVDPALLKANRQKIEELFPLIEKNGDQTRDQITKVKRLIETPQQGAQTRGPGKPGDSKN
ncbi:MAG: TIR domain-containing protein [Blastocatellia bacterium]